ncbi:MAG: hypothetical protein U9Q91_04515 [Candidatus Marinimicrobia bacterium]|nr:hypothetical protein [Candidatus Neomarinimicrobiota bacterium]
MKSIKLFIIYSLILFLILSCSREPWGFSLEHIINTRNPKYRIELKKWDSIAAYGSGIRRLYVYKSGSKRRIVELSGGGRFSGVYWKDKDNLVVIDFEGIHSSQKHGIRKFKYGELTITNICYIYNGFTTQNIKCDSLIFENGLITFYSTELDRNYQRIITVPIDQYIFSYEIKDNVVVFTTIADKSTEPIVNYNMTIEKHKIKISDSNISKLNYFISQQME